MSQTYEHRSSWMGAIDICVRGSISVDNAACITVWADADTLAAYSTYQLQRWIVSARSMRRATDRDGEILIDRAKRQVVRLLHARGAWTWRASAQSYDIECALREEAQL